MLPDGSSGDTDGVLTHDGSLTSGRFRIVTPDLVFALADGFKQSLLGAVEGQAARQQDEEDDPAAPHVHRLPVRLSLHHLRRHEVGRPHTPCGHRDTQVNHNRPRETITAPQSRSNI